ncbi:Helicase associated domain protein [Nonomuraea sp. NPDC003707]
MNSYSSTWADKLRPHQLDAVSTTAAAFTHEERATVAMPCGGGKTWVGAAVAAARMERADADRILIVAPFLELLTQTIRQWRALLGDAMLGRLIAVCSDQRVLDEHRGDLRDERVSVTCDAGELVQLASGPGRMIVASTYHSLPVIAAAHEQRLPMFDLIVVDEAHRSVGRMDNPWAIVHSNAHIPADRRLYLTATPKVIGGSGDDDVVSMDDAKIFGQVTRPLTFSAAQDMGLLARYQTVVPVVTDEQIRAAARQPQPEEFYQHGTSALSPDMLATQIAVLRAAHEKGIRRMITFHSRVAGAKWFAATLSHAAALLDAAERPARLWTGHVHGGQPLDQRRAILDRLRSDDDGLIVISNARVLGEGIDVPAIDAVAFIDARESPIDIIQAIGRALRSNPEAGPKIASIIVPALLGPDEDPETALEGSAFAPVWQIVRALAAHDDSLATHLGRLRRRLGSESTAGAAASDGGPELPEWLAITGVPVPPDFARAITVQTIRAGSHSWEEYFGAAEAYVAESGDLLVPESWETPSGLRLGRWVQRLRILRREGSLSTQWSARMDAIGMVWDVRADGRQRLLAECRKYRKKYGNLLVPKAYVAHDDTDDDPPYPLGSNLYGFRSRYRAGTLDPAFAAELTALGVVWNVRDAEREQLLSDLIDYRAQHGDLDVPQNYVTPGPNGRKLGQQVVGVRRNRREGTLAQEEVDELEQLGFIWNAPEWRFKRYMKALYAYKKANKGSVDVPVKYVTPPPENLTLGRWLSQRKNRHGKGRLAPQHAEALQKAGVKLPAKDIKK